MLNMPSAMKESTDFSLVLGGPLYQMFRRAHLSGDTLELLRRRIVFIALLLTMMPLEELLKKLFGVLF